MSMLATSVWQVEFLADAQRLLLVNVALVVLVVGFSVGVATALVRRSMRAKLESERLAAMGTATARILHQVKNPLQTLILHGEMLEDTRMMAEPSLRKEVADAIVTEAGRISELLEELSSYASGVRRSLEPKPVALHELVGEVLGRESRESERAGIELRRGRIDEVVAVADPYFLRQALENVVRNAREALADQPPGRERRLEISLHRSGARAVIRVADTGPGLPPERTADVLRPFVTTKTRGMGLGLPISREIMEAHGGRLELSSRPGAGTKVSLVLPVRTGTGAGPSRAR